MPDLAHFPLLSLETVSDEAAETLQMVHKKFGKIPNIIGTMANAPVTLKSYAALGANLAKAGFDPIEMQLINLTISVENDCRYCIAAHSTALKKGLKVEADVVASIRAGEAVQDPRWNALITTIRILMRNKGAISANSVTEFTDAGYSKKQMLDLLSAIAMKTLTNYLDHMTQIDLDPAYQPEA